ncbi:MAG: hypothetical protein AAGF73_16890 [Actinomycetota bacterium]
MDAPTTPLPPSVDTPPSATSAADTASAGAPPPLPPPAPPTPAGGRRGRHIAALIIGIVALIPGVGALAGGTTALVAQGVATDEDGYFVEVIDGIADPGVAIASDDLWVTLDGKGHDGDAPRILEWLDVDARLRVDAVGEQEVFAGIARASDVERYLDGVEYGRIVELDKGAAQVINIAGSTAIAAPAEQDFWVESTSGAGEQVLEWDVRPGRWAVVVMNADASPGVDVDVEAGLRSGAITPVAITLLIGGALVTAGAVAAIVFRARGDRRRRTPAT